MTNGRKQKWANRAFFRFAHFSPFNLLLWAAFFALYAATTARDVLPADSGEFQLTAATWGIAHPPGYPLYTVASALWMRLIPIGAVVFRINLFSAALAATTLVLIAAAVRTWATVWGYTARAAQAGGLAAALLFGSASTFWAQATIANIRMPTMLFAAWGFLALAHYRAAQTGSHNSKIPPLIELALALGLGVGHHPSLIFIAVGWALYLLLIDPRLFVQPQRWWKVALVTALAWFIPQLYLPLRGSMANVPLAPGDLATWSGFWNHVLARGFEGDMFAFATATDLALRLPLLPTLFRLQFPPVFLVAIGLSWLWMLRRDGKLAAMFFVAWVLHTFITITYRAPQTIEYLMPAYVPMVLAFGLGVGGIANCKLEIRNHELRVKHHASRITHFSSLISYFLFLFTFCALLIRFPLLVPDFAILAADTSIRERTAPLLDATAQEPDALILADWHWATPLWVLQYVEQWGPRAEVAYVYPVAGQAYEDVWRARAETAGDRALFTTHNYTWEGWTSTPVGGGYRFYRRPLSSLPEELDFIPLDADLGTVQVLGYRIVGEVKPGRQVELHVAWQAKGQQESVPSFTARLWDADGALLAQADRSLGSDTAEGEVRFTQLILQMPVDRCTDVIYPTLGAYTVTDGAFQDMGSVSLPELTSACNFPTLPVARPWPGVVVNGGPGLRGVDYNTDDAEATAYLHWCGPGQALIVESGDSRAFVHPLGLGDCQTVRIAVPLNERPQLTFTRVDGSPARWLGLALPAPTSGERYVPFGDEMVLTGSDIAQRGETLVLNLRWRTARPIVNDYAVSVRLFGVDGEWLGMHDIQPGLGALPTLKWIVRDGPLLDPHPYELEGQPANVTVAVYERFRLTPLTTPDGGLATFPFP
ncbi:MAG: protein O-mannosyl-transferase family [Anaerolineae bacterium]